MQVIGVIGAGQMGAGIAQVSAQAGYRVLLSDVSLAQAERGRTGIANQLDRAVAKEKITIPARDGALALIEPVAGVEAMESCTLVIEAATEREDIKRQIFTQVGTVLGDDAILASNTSSIPITRLAQAAPDPARFVGVHFFNPVPVMGLIELIRGLATSDATVATVERYAQALGKRVVHANDAPGFIVNRVLMPMLNEACFALGEGVATIADIDAAVQLGLNHPVGPLTLADFIGLDTCLEITRVLFEGTGRSQVPARTAAGKICRGGLVWPQDEARLLRLYGRRTRPDTLRSAAMSLDDTIIDTPEGPMTFAQWKKKNPVQLPSRRTKGKDLPNKVKMRTDEDDTKK